MKLLNEMFILDKALDGNTFLLTLNASHPIYKAHFPGMPITPGVCMIRIAEELVERVVGKALHMSGAKDVKFINLLTPSETDDTTVKFEFAKVQSLEDKMSCVVNVSRGELRIAKLNLIFEMIN